MKKILIAGMIATVFLSSCKDEFNLPEYDSYIDGDAPTFDLLYPSIDTLIDYQDSISFNIICRDNYALDSFFFEMQPDDLSADLISYKTAVNDSVYTFNNRIALPKAEPTRYEVYVRAIDAAGNSKNKVYFFSTK